MDSIKSEKVLYTEGDGRETEGTKDIFKGSQENNTSKSSGARQNKSIIVLVNPHSGRGRSISIYRKIIVPLFNSLNIEHENFITQSDSRAYDYLFKKDIKELSNIRSLVVVSGDGLIHETINALMARDDWKQAIRVPLGIIPTGSGNGLAYTLVRQTFQDVRSEDEAIRICSEQVVKDETCSADLVKITFQRKSPIWSFLSIGWGLLADIDVDSEWLRCLGEFRFTIYGLLRCLTSVSYLGRLSFKISSKSLTDDELKSVFKSNATSDMYNNEIEENIFKDEAWVHIEDKFACIYAVHQSYVSSVTNFAPKSTLTDQLIYLTYIRGKLNPCRVVEFLLAIKDGSHDRLPYVAVVPTTNLVFQPLEASKIVIDGEVVPWDLSDGPLIAEVVPKVVKLLWRPLDGQRTES